MNSGLFKIQRQHKNKTGKGRQQLPIPKPKVENKKIRKIKNVFWLQQMNGMLFWVFGQKPFTKVSRAKSEKVSIDKVATCARSIPFMNGEKFGEICRQTILRQLFSCYLNAPMKTSSSITIVYTSGTEIAGGFGKLSLRNQLTKLVWIWTHEWFYSIWKVINNNNII